MADDTQVDPYKAAPEAMTNLSDEDRRVVCRVCGSRYIKFAGLQRHLEKNKADARHSEYAASFQGVPRETRTNTARIYGISKSRRGYY